MKYLLAASLALVCMNSYAQHHFKVKLTNDALYWTKRDSVGMYAKGKFDSVTLEKEVGIDEYKYWTFHEEGKLYYTTLDYVVDPTPIKEFYKAERKKQTELRKQRLISKYGRETADLILNGRMRIGMTKQMAIESWGKPEKIHSTIFPNSVYEQWVYPNYNYLYFENGLLTTIQN
ncbi:MAG TPA: hypothetical protein VHB54_12815 [Mucilaginibacter sp.]|nr:hypothetical protein [Mucilaginibacter sp.]